MTGRADIAPHESELDLLEEARAAQAGADPENGARWIAEDPSSVDELIPSVQCLLFVSGRPVTTADVASMFALDEAAAELLLNRVAATFPAGGLQVVRVAGGYEMATRPEFASLITRFLEPRPSRLSRPALEALALIAYRQPLTLPEIDAIRGVKSDSSVRTLLERGLIEEAGRRDAVGRPILYRTTEEFLVHLGIHDLSELPSLESAEEVT